MTEQRLVYYMDDDDDDLFLLQEISEGLCVSCETFNNGNELLQRLVETTSLPKIIYLDLNMPAMDGYDVIESIRSFARFDDIILIAQSGTNQESSIQKCLSLGVNYFIRKPSNYASFRSAIEFTLEKDWNSHLPTRVNFVYGE